MLGPFILDGEASWRKWHSWLSEEEKREQVGHRTLQVTGPGAEPQKWELAWGVVAIPSSSHCLSTDTGEILRILQASVHVTSSEEPS